MKLLSKKMIPVLVAATFTAVLTGCGPSPIEAVKKDSIGYHSASIDQIFSSYPYLKNVVWAESKDKKEVMVSFDLPKFSALDSDMVALYTQIFKEVEEQYRDETEKFRDYLVNDVLSHKQRFEEKYDGIKKNALILSEWNTFEAVIKEGLKYDGDRSIEAFEKYVESYKDQAHWLPILKEKQEALANASIDKMKEKIDRKLKEAENYMDPHVLVAKEQIAASRPWAQTQSAQVTFKFVPGNAKQRTQLIGGQTNVVWKDGKKATLEHDKNMNTQFVDLIADKKPIWACDKCQDLKTATKFSESYLPKLYEMAK